MEALCPFSYILPYVPNTLYKQCIPLNSVNHSNKLFELQGVVGIINMPMGEGIICSLQLASDVCVPGGTDGGWGPLYVDSVRMELS